MKQVTGSYFVAFDGTPFFDPEACEKHEEASFPRRFVGLTLEQVAAAFDGRDADLAAAFRKAGARVRQPRRGRQDNVPDIAQDNVAADDSHRPEDGWYEPPKDFADGHALVEFPELSE